MKTGRTACPAPGWCDRNLRVRQTESLRLANRTGSTNELRRALKERLTGLTFTFILSWTPWPEPTVLPVHGWGLLARVQVAKICRYLERMGTWGENNIPRVYQADRGLLRIAALPAPCISGGALAPRTGAPLYMDAVGP